MSQAMEDHERFDESASTC